MSNYRQENFPKSIYYAKRYVRINSEGDKYSIDKECILFVDQKRKKLILYLLAALIISAPFSPL